MLPYFHKSTLRKGSFLYLSKPVEVGISGEAMLCTTIVFNNVSPLPCSHPACSEFCVHLKFLPEIVCKAGKVCKVIILGYFEPPVRVFGATVPEKGSHEFRCSRATFVPCL